jgi:hypothetical protein
MAEEAMKMGGERTSGELNLGLDVQYFLIDF